MIYDDPFFCAYCCNDVHCHEEKRAEYREDFKLCVTQEAECNSQVYVSTTRSHGQRR